MILMEHLRLMQVVEEEVDLFLQEDLQEVLDLLAELGERDLVMHPVEMDQIIEVVEEDPVDMLQGNQVVMVDQVLL